MAQQCIIESDIIKLLCSSQGHVKSFTYVSFTMAVCGENSTWATGRYFAMLRVATGPDWTLGYEPLTSDSDKHHDFQFEARLSCVQTWMEIILWVEQIDQLYNVELTEQKDRTIPLLNDALTCYAEKVNNAT